MITISLCMIVRDEETVLGRCLAGVAGVADEIIVVDTGSADGTREVAASWGAKVHAFAWEDDFSAARNAAFEKASMDYILWLDADDVVDRENRAALLSLKEALDPAVDVVMMRYHIAFDSGGNPTYTFYRERLLRRAAGFRWTGRVHEAIVPSGKVIRSPIAIRHEKAKPGDPLRNLRIYEKMLAQGERMNPRHRYYYARELFANGREGEAIPLLRQTAGDPEAWVENRIGACRDLAACLLRQGNREGALEALARSFALGAPRAEVCCDLGRVFLERNDCRSAIFWYRAATECVPSEEDGGFAQPDCRGYIPYMQLCVCHDRLGEYDDAEAYNEKAAALKPGDAAARKNREYFSLRRGLRAEAPP